MSKYNFVDCIDIVGNTVDKFDDLKLYISTGAINFNTIDYTKIEKVSYIDKPSRANLEVKSGDVLFAKMQNTKKTFIIDNITKDYIYSTGFYAVRPKSDILSKECLYYILSSNSFLLQKDKNCSGTTQKAITNNGLKKIEVTIPDLSIQNKIVNKLQMLDKIISLLDNMLLQFDKIVKAKFIEMFGDLYAGTCKYSTNKLKNLSIKISDGIHSKPEYTPSGKPFLSVVNISKKRIDFTDCKYVSEETYKKMIKSTHPEKGDILYTKVGTYGIPAYVDTDVEFCLYVSVCLIKPNHNLINSKFLALQMDMPFIKYQADRRIRGIGVPDLHLNQIAEFDLLCPPRYLQDKFVNFVNNIEKSKSTVKKCLEKAELLKSALTQKYFN